MGKRNTNPRKIPKTQADVDRAEAKGRLFGMEFMGNLILWILADKHDAPDEDMNQLTKEINYLCSSINEGYVSYPDICRALREEHNTEFSIE